MCQTSLSSLATVAFNQRGKSLQNQVEELELENSPITPAKENPFLTGTSTRLSACLKSLDIKQIGTHQNLSTWHAEAGESPGESPVQSLHGLQNENQASQIVNTPPHKRSHWITDISPTDRFCDLLIVLKNLKQNKTLQLYSLLQTMDFFVLVMGTTAVVWALPSFPWQLLCAQANTLNFLALKISFRTTKGSG